MSIRVIVEPETLPLKVQDVVRNSRLDDYEPIDIHRLIQAATDYMEKATERAFITRSIEWNLDCFSPVLKTPQGKLQEVVSISYVDVDGAVQTLPAENYRVDIAGGRITPAFGESWPAVRAVISPITITLKVGYGSADKVPYGLIQGLLILCEHWNENRGEVVVGTIVGKLPRAVNDIVDRFRIYSL